MDDAVKEFNIATAYKAGDKFIYQGELYEVSKSSMEYNILPEYESGCHKIPLESDKLEEIEESKKDSLLILEDYYDQESVYEYILVPETDLYRAKDIVKQEYDNWKQGKWISSNVFESIHKALENAGIPYLKINDWESIKL